METLGNFNNNNNDDGFNGTDYANRTAPIYSINPDFITQW